MENTPEHEILILVAAMIADGKPCFSPANIQTMVKQAITARHLIYSSAKLELEALATRERKEADDRETAAIKAMLEKQNEVHPHRPAA